MHWVDMVLKAYDDTLELVLGHAWDLHELMQTGTDLARCS